MRIHISVMTTKISTSTINLAIRFNVKVKNSIKFTFLLLSLHVFSSSLSSHSIVYDMMWFEWCVCLRVALMLHVPWNVNFASFRASVIISYQFIDYTLTWAKWIFSCTFCVCVWECTCHEESAQCICVKQQQNFMKLIWCFFLSVCHCEIYVSSLVSPSFFLWKCTFINIMPCRREWNSLLVHFIAFTTFQREKTTQH